MSPTSPRSSPADLLWKNLVPFWLEHGFDRAHGGFHSDLAPDGRARPGGGKSLVQAGRSLWSFAALHRALPDTRFAEGAAWAHTFLEDHLHDPVHGGWCRETEAGGVAHGREKHLYGHAYLLYGAAEAWLAWPEDPRYREMAESCWALIERQHDGEHGGWLESFAEDWSAAPQPESFGGPESVKTLNTHLHLMEAFTPLLEASGDALVHRRLEELVDIHIARLIDPERATGLAHHTRDWHPLLAPRSFGHDFETAWLLHVAARAIGRDGETRVRDAALGLTRSAMREGLHPERHHVLAEDGSGAIWWEQAEALVALDLAADLTGEAAFREAFDRVWHWTAHQQIDHARGEWHALVTADGPADRSKGTMWKTPYHTARALLRLEGLTR